MDIQNSNRHQFTLLNHQFFLSLEGEVFHLLITNNSTCQKYRSSIDQQSIKNNKNLQFFFNSPEEIFAYFKDNNTNNMELRDGNLYLSIQANLGKSIKVFECVIQTVNQELSLQERMKIKCEKIEKQVQLLKIQNVKIKSNIDTQEEAIKGIKRQFEQCMKNVCAKDEIITNIFKELEEISKWKEQNEKILTLSSYKDRFISDESNPHNKKFSQKGNRFTKNCGGSWDVIMCKNTIEKQSVFRYHIKQIKAGPNGSLMYGVATEAVKGMNRAQDSKDFIGYYENTGFIFEQGTARKSGPRIKDGQTVTIQVDTKIWKVIWYIEGKKEGESSISKQLREKPLHLTIIVFNQSSQIQFI